MYTRKYFDLILNRLKEPRGFIQILYGSRQIGKTTLIKQVINDIKTPVHYASADDSPAVTSIWLDQLWDTCRLKYSQEKSREYLLVIDEVQKIPNWSETIKKNWDQDSFNDINIKLVLLGSAPIAIQKGLSESLAGRFELIHLPHWSFREMRDAFGFSLDEYIYYGGYPGSAKLIADNERWRDYIKHSLVDSVISKDILSLSNIQKPTLLRRVFELGAFCSAQILSYNKMLGQLQDVGNTVTIAHYLDLLSISGLLHGVEKYSTNVLKVRSSSPKFQVYNNALMTTQHKQSFSDATKDAELWGRFVESAVGAFLLNESIFHRFNIYYWRDRNAEVDFILEKDGVLVAIEVKTSRTTHNYRGLEQFSSKFPKVKKILVGKDGLILNDFFQMNVEELFAI
ncbi:MAG: ATP-binding protein [Candidatus Margulisiibacteriota bacterium]